MDGVGVLDYGQRSVSSFLREERASSTDMVGRHSPSVLVSNGAFPVPDLPMYARDDVAGARLAGCHPSISDLTPPMAASPFPQSAEQLILEAWAKVQLNVIELRTMAQDIEHYVREMLLFDAELESIGSDQLVAYRDLILSKTRGVDTDARLKSMSLTFPFFSKIIILHSHNHAEYERLLDRMVVLVAESNRTLREHLSHASFCIVKKHHGNYVIPNVVYREKKPRAVPFKPPVFPFAKESPAHTPEWTPRESSEADRSTSGNISDLF